MTGSATSPEHLQPAAGGPLDQAEQVCELVHGSLEYADGVTSVRTTAAEALASGRGVCRTWPT